MTREKRKKKKKTTLLYDDCNDNDNDDVGGFLDGEFITYIAYKTLITCVTFTHFTGSEQHL